MKKISVLIIFLSFIFPASPKESFIGDNKLYYGAAYYPEAWPEENIDADIENMKEAGVNVVRMAEFAWFKMEPEEGQYNFGWLHNVIDKLHSKGIDVILGTPTATPPAWLAEKHPEIYRVTQDGVRLHHGGRRDCSYTSKVYNDYCNKIVEAMAKEFGHKDGVIGWQTDNEMTLTPDYSEETRQQWMRWLKEKYKTPENLNELWNLDLWSQGINDFGQVPLPTDNVTHHYSLLNAWNEFNNSQIAAFQNNQIDIIRKYSDLPITHDSMPNQAVDYERLFAPLDFPAINVYHSFEAYDLIQSNYDRMRGFKKRNHWIFETAPNNSGGGGGGNTWYLHQIPGSLNAAIWMSFASGGQGAMYWPWRQHWAGQEIPHGAIISAWGKPAANWNEIKQLGEELENYSDLLMNNPVEPAKVAIIFSNNALNSLNIEKIANGLRYYPDWTYRFYRPIADNYIFRDVIYPDTDFSDYKLLFVPLLPQINDDTRKRLKEWVEMGGILIFGPMSGYRSPEWTQYTNHFTGDLEDWMGIEVESFIPIGTERRDKEIPFNLSFNSNLGIKDSEASLWSLALQTEKGKEIAKYTTGHHAGKTAIAENKIGKGKIIYMGTDPGQEALGKLLKKYAKEAGINPDASGDPGIVVVPRSGSGKGVILVNITPDEKGIVLDKKYSDFIDINSGEKLNNAREVKLKPFEKKLYFKSN